MSIEQTKNAYLGDIIGGITKEAAYGKLRCSALEAQVQKLQVDLAAMRSEHPGAETGAYISADHTLEAGHG